MSAGGARWTARIAIFGDVRQWRRSIHPSDALRTSGPLGKLDESLAKRLVPKPFCFCFFVSLNWEKWNKWRHQYRWEIFNPSPTGGTCDTRTAPTNQNVNDLFKVTWQLNRQYRGRQARDARLHQSLADGLFHFKKFFLIEFIFIYSFFLVRNVPRNLPFDWKKWSRSIFVCRAAATVPLSLAYSYSRHRLRWAAAAGRDRCGDRPRRRWIAIYSFWNFFHIFLRFHSSKLTNIA